MTWQDQIELWQAGGVKSNAMLEAAKNLLLILSAIFPIVDPIGGSPFFLALTGGYSSDARKALSWRIAVDSFVLLVGSYFRRYLHSRFLWDFATGSAGGWRNGPRCDGVGDVDGK